MAIHWQLKFKSLRRSTDYTVNIYDDQYSGNPVVLKGGAEPFSTQEDTDEDLFEPIRTQSGYLRIVDDGFAADGTTPFDWHTFIPSTDTDRPVTLTHVEGTTTVVDWQGFMQAQDFGSELYGNPQEREYPIQCSLSVAQGADINYNQKGLQNFAYLLKQLIDNIPSISRPTTVVVQGGSLAQAFLLTMIDWQTFVEENSEEDLEARCTIYDAFEEMCMFWGWCARTCKQTLYLTCPDDQDEQMTKFLTLTMQDLADMAAGTYSGTVSSGTYPTYPLTGNNLFASIDNEDYLQRGHNKATVKTDVGDGKVLDFESDRLEDLMEAQGWKIPYRNPEGNLVSYTNDLTSLNLPLMTGSARAGYGTFSLMSVWQRDNMESNTIMPVLRILKTMESRTGSAYISLETEYHHCFAEGYLQLHGVPYVFGTQYKTEWADNTHMYMRLGIGPDRASAVWWNGERWGADASSSFAVLLGASSNILQTIGPNRGVINIPCEFESPYYYIFRGKVFIDILGSDDTEEGVEIAGQCAFEIADFSITFNRRKEYNDPYRIVETDKKSSKDYKSDNGNAVKNVYNESVEYASDANLAYGYKLLIDGRFENRYQYLKGYQYIEHGTVEHPEQHLADRVTAYGATAKRRLKVDLRNDNYMGVWMADISPQMFLQIDGTKTYPISISHNWRDDITTIISLQIP